MILFSLSLSKRQNITVFATDQRPYEQLAMRTCSIHTEQAKSTGNKFPLLQPILSPFAFAQLSSIQMIQVDGPEPKMIMLPVLQPLSFFRFIAFCYIAKVAVATRSRGHSGRQKVKSR